MKTYESLYKKYPTQALDCVFAHFYPINGDYDEPLKAVARLLTVLTPGIFSKIGLRINILTLRSLSFKTI